MESKPRRIPENIIRALEEEQMQHETYLHQTLARKLAEAGVDLEA